MNRPPRIAHVATVDLTVRFLLLGQLIGLRDAGFDVAAVSAPGPWVEEIEAEGISHIPWHNATRAWDLKADALALEELVRLFRRERFDLVHTHNPKPGILGRIAARAAAVPVVVNTVHGLYATPEDRISKRLPVLAAEALSARCSDLELYQSEEDLDWARHLHIVPRSRSEWLGNGVDLSSFDPARFGVEQRAHIRRSMGIETDALVVGTVGRIVAEKGYRELFAAAKRVRARCPRATFLVVGEPDADKKDALGVEELRTAGEGIVFAGWRTDIPEMMAAMDVFALPSWREGLPRSAIEAAAMALPLVLSDIRGCREVARDGIEGSLVPPRNPIRLADALERLLEDTDLRASAGCASRDRALARFDERRVVRTVVERTTTLLQRREAKNSRRSPASVTHEGGFDIRQALPDDARTMARLHRESLPEAFLPLLGDRFLAQLYRSIVSDPMATAIVAVDGEGIAGFATGVTSLRRAYRRFVLRRGIPALVAAAPHLLDRRVIRGIRETASYPSSTGALPEAELLSIAVDPSRRQQGMGTALANALVHLLKCKGADEVRVVVAADNVSANSFYRSVGFSRVGTLAVHPDRASNVWVTRCRS